jgi:hypothetical protein
MHSAFLFVSLFKIAELTCASYYFYGYMQNGEAKSFIGICMHFFKVFADSLFLYFILLMAWYDGSTAQQDMQNQAGVLTFGVCMRGGSGWGVARLRHAKLMFATWISFFFFDLSYTLCNYPHNLCAVNLVCAMQNCLLMARVRLDIADRDAIQ